MAIFRRGGGVKTLDPFQQTSGAKEPGIRISNGKRLFYQAPASPLAAQRGGAA